MKNTNMKERAFKIYLVGGAVRDQLLDLPVVERDWVVVGATPEDLLSLGYRPVGKDFPVFLHPETQDEYALARTERKKGRGYKGFECHFSETVSLEEDLLRRDLTINAMAMDEKGHLIDPYHGQRDLADRMLRHVSPAFVEDPLRVLRLARFYARYAPLGFRVAPETLALIQQMSASGELCDLVPERVWQEVAKVLVEKEPQHFFQLLRDVGALAVLFPEIDSLFGIPNPEKWHPEIDTGIHTLMVLEAAAKLTQDPVVRFAALVHDLGKAMTPAAVLPKHPGHGIAGVPIIKNLCRRYRIPTVYEELAVLVSQYHIDCHACETFGAKGLLKLLKNLDVWRRPARFEQFLLACEADSRGRTGFTEMPYSAGAFLIALYMRLQSVDVKSIIDAGFEAAAIGVELHRRRLQRVAQFLATREERS